VEPCDQDRPRACRTDLARMKRHDRLPLNNGGEPHRSGAPDTAPTTSGERERRCAGADGAGVQLLRSSRRQRAKARAISRAADRHGSRRANGHNAGRRCRWCGRCRRTAAVFGRASGAAGRKRRGRARVGVDRCQAGRRGIACLGGMLDGVRDRRRRLVRERGQRRKHRNAREPGGGTAGERGHRGHSRHSSGQRTSSTTSATATRRFSHSRSKGMRCSPRTGR
jgi:hypothetical protein